MNAYDARCDSTSFCRIFWLFPRYWVSPPRILLVVGAIFLLAIGLSFVMMTTMWDGYYDQGYGGTSKRQTLVFEYDDLFSFQIFMRLCVPVVLSPLWVVYSFAMATGWIYFFVYTVKRFLNSFIFFFTALHFLVGLVFMAVKADAGTNILWTPIMTFLFWVPDSVFLVFLARSLIHALKKSSSLPAPLRLRRPVAVVRSLSRSTVCSTTLNFQFLRL